MQLRYFIRIPDIGCAETDASAARLLSRGFKECPRDYYITWWTLKSMARQAELARIRPIERAVGEAPPALPPGYVLPAGYTLHKV